jgi:hypothetical protein
MRMAIAKMPGDWAISAPGFRYISGCGDAAIETLNSEQAAR